MTGPGEDENRGEDGEHVPDPAEKVLPPVPPPTIPIINESDRLTDLMDHWDVQGQQRDGMAEFGGSSTKKLT